MTQYHNVMVLCHCLERHLLGDMRSIAICVFGDDILLGDIAVYHGEYQIR